MRDTTLCRLKSHWGRHALYSVARRMSADLAVLLLQVLFFSRLLADVCGRTIPRVKRLAVHSRMTLLGLGCFMTASIPAYLYYIRASPWHNDWAITGAHVASSSTALYGRANLVCCK